MTRFTSYNYSPGNRGGVRHYSSGRGSGGKWFFVFVVFFAALIVFFADDEQKNPENTANSSSSSNISASVKKLHPPKPILTYEEQQNDSILANRIRLLLERYKPFAASIILLDPVENRLLAWGEWSDSSLHQKPRFLHQGHFPGASLMKMISAAAALDVGGLGRKSLLPAKGRNHTLYLRQLDIPRGYRGRTISLEQAFARSMNPPFGVMGQRLGGKHLRETAYKLAFGWSNTKGYPEASTYLPPDTGYAVAEAASGFTDQMTLSPLLAAMIMRSFLQNESPELPALPFWAPGTKQNTPQATGRNGLSRTANASMRKLLIATVEKGTARRATRETVYSYNRKRFLMGGKTGTLDGKNPDGRYEWYAGFARDKTDPNHALVIVVMQVHDQLRTLSSSRVAGLLVNFWAKRDEIEEKHRLETIRVDSVRRMDSLNTSTF